MLLGNFYKKPKRPQDAIAAYRDALARDSEHQNALFSLALAYKDEGRLDEARVGFERARDARSAERQGARGSSPTCGCARATSARAEAIITDALERKVDEHRLLLKLGESRIEAKRFDEAERALKAALEKKPGLALAHFDLGLVYEGQGQIDKAIESYEAELATNPKAYRAAFNAAKLLQKSGRSTRGGRALPQGGRDRADLRDRPALSRARRCWTPAISAAPSSGRATGLTNNPEPRMAPLGHYVLADVYERQGRAADARREVEAGKHRAAEAQRPRAPTDR